MVWIDKKYKTQESGYRYGEIGSHGAYTIAMRLGLDPFQKNGEGAWRIRCAHGCDDGVRRSDRGALLNPSGVHNCFKCECSFHISSIDPRSIAERAADELRARSRRVAPDRPPPVDMAKVLASLENLRYRFASQLTSWGQDKRGWDASLVANIGRVEGLMYAPDGENFGDDLTRFCRSHRRARVCVMMYGSDGKPTSAERRYLGPAPKGRPKSLSMPSVIVGGNPHGRYFGDMTKAKDAECVVVTEGGPDYVAASLVVKAMGWGARVVGVPGFAQYAQVPDALTPHLGPETRVIAAPHANDSNARTRETCDAMLEALRARGVRAGVVELKPYAGESKGYDVADLVRAQGDQAAAVVGALLKAAYEGASLGLGASRSYTGLTLERARALTRELIFETIRSGGSLHSAASCGTGKSHALQDGAAAHMLENRPGVYLYLAKDREHAVAVCEAIDARVGRGRQVKMLLGRGGEIPDEPRSWRPAAEPRAADSEGRVWTCGSAKVLRQLAEGKKSSGCSDCPLVLLCQGEGDGPKGTWGMRLALKQEKQERGQVLVVTLPMLAEAIRLIGEDSVAAVVVDDVAYPNPEEVSLRAFNAHFGDETPWMAAVLKWEASIRERAFVEDRAYAGDWRGGEAALALLDGVDWRAVSAHGKTDDAPRALTTLAEAAREPGAARLYIRCDDGRIVLGAWRQGLELPAQAALVVANATAQTEVWGAYFGRPQLERVKLQVQAPEVLDGVWVKNTAYDRARWIKTRELDDLERRIGNAALRVRQVLSGAIEDQGAGSRALLVAHLRHLQDPRWETLQAKLLEGAGLSRAHVDVVHWRGVEQVGSNRFSDHDICITLGTPRLNLGAWARLAQAVRAWGGDGAAVVAAYNEDAQGMQEQAAGRLRWVFASSRKLLVHIGSCPGETLQALAPTALTVDAHRPAFRTMQIEDWCEREWAHEAWGPVLHRLEGGSRAGWVRHCQTLNLPRWTTKIGRTRTHWFSASSDAALAAARDLASRRGQPPDAVTLSHPPGHDLTVSRSGVGPQDGVSNHFRTPSPNPSNPGSTEEPGDPIGPTWQAQWRDLERLWLEEGAQTLWGWIEDERFGGGDPATEGLRMWTIARLFAAKTRLAGVPCDGAVEEARIQLHYDETWFGFEDNTQRLWEPLEAPLRAWVEGIKPPD